jgi:hypothetical protein
MFWPPVTDALLGKPGSADSVAVLVAVPGVHAAAVAEQAADEHRVAVAEPGPAVALQAAVEHVVAVAELVPDVALQAAA